VSRQEEDKGAATAGVCCRCGSVCLPSHAWAQGQCGRAPGVEPWTRDADCRGWSSALAFFFFLRNLALALWASYSNKKGLAHND
jgi:hypothetical protein